MTEILNNLAAALLAWVAGTGLRVVLILVGAYILTRALKTATGKLKDILVKREEGVESVKRIDTLTNVINHVAVVLLWMVVAITLLGQLGVNIGPVLATVGVAGLAIGFGAQNLVRDVFTGFFLILENQVRVGDVVEVAGNAGYVESMNLRVTTLRDFGGNAYIIPNGSIDKVKNMTLGFSRTLVEVGVSYRENADEVLDVLKEVADGLAADPGWKDDILEPAEVFGIDDFGDSALLFKVRMKTVPIKQWNIARELRKRIKKAFDERGIEIPFPHMTVYMGEPKEGTAPPLNVSVLKQDASAA